MSRWENIGDKYLLNALGADPLAASQSVAMYLDPVAKCIEWHTNGHVIRLRPDLPSAIVSGPFPTSFGYEWNLAGGLVFGVGDVSLTKRAGILDQWGLQGVQLYYIVPVGQIPDIPVIKIEKIDILDGMISQLDLTPQGVLSAEEIADGHTRAAQWVDHSMRLGWLDKANNLSGDNNSNYMSGKILHKAPPLAMPLVCADLQAGNNANRSFSAAGGSETTGWYETLSGGFQKAYNRQDLVDRRGVGTHYAFAATLGYTSIGGTSLASNFLFTSGPFQLAADGNVESYSIYNFAVNATSYNIGVYTDTGATFPNSLVEQEHKEDVNGPVWSTVLSSGTPALSALTDYWVGANTLSAFARRYDATGGTPSTQRDTAAGYPATLPATHGAGSNFNLQFSMYLTVTAGGGGGIIPQIMHHRRMMRH